MHARLRLAVAVTALICALPLSTFAQDNTTDTAGGDATQDESSDTRPDTPPVAEGRGAEADIAYTPDVGHAVGSRNRDIPYTPDVGKAVDSAPDLALNPFTVGCVFTPDVGGYEDLYVALKNTSGIPIPAGSTYIIKGSNGITLTFSFKLEIPAGETLYAQAPDGSDAPDFTCEAKVIGA